MHSDHLDLADLEVCEDTRRSWQNNGRNRENRARKGLRAEKENSIKVSNQSEPLLDIEIHTGQQAVLRSPHSALTHSK